MECEQFRQRIGADPADSDERCAEHERSCAACAAYARRLRASERHLAAALRVDVERLRRPAATRVARLGVARMRLWAVAASFLVAGFAIWLGLRFVPSDDPLVLARAVEDHWSLEPESWVRTRTPVATTVLEAALGDDVRLDLEQLDVVSYARSCLVNGRWVPHLVVQGQAGPVMVLLLARESLVREIPLDIPEQKLRGIIVPVAQSSIAILGEDGESLETIRQNVTEAVDWTT